MTQSANPLDPQAQQALQEVAPKELKPHALVLCELNDKPVSDCHNQILLDIEGRNALALLVSELISSQEFDAVHIVASKSVHSDALTQALEPVLSSAQTQGCPLQIHADFLNVTEALQAIPRFAADAQELVCIVAEAALIKADHVQSFMRMTMRARDRAQAQIVSALVPQKTIAEELPGYDMSCMSVREGEYAPALLLYVQTAALLAAQDQVLQLLHLRKSPSSALKTFGAAFALSFIAGKLSVHDLEVKLSEMTSCTCKCIQLRHSAAALYMHDAKSVNMVKACVAARINRGEMPALDACCEG